MASTAALPVNVKSVLVGPDFSFRHPDCLVLTVGLESDRDSPIERHPARNTFLFATDFGATSLHALPYAVCFTNHFGAKLALLHVLPTVPMPEGHK